MQVQDDKPYDDINITPMLDLAYVLLVIFILMCTASVQGLKASLPKASDSPSKPKDKPEKPFVVTIDDDGGIHLGTKKDTISLAQLEQEAGRFKSESTEGHVVLNGSTRTHYEVVVNALDVMGKVGLTHIGLTTQSRTAKK
jgi:biopolymer transport protein ExbD